MFAARGEEFVVVMPDADLSVAYTVAERIRERVAGTPFPIKGGTEAIPATISIGVSTLHLSSDSPEELLKRADEALYSANVMPQPCCGEEAKVCIKKPRTMAGIEVLCT